MEKKSLEMFDLLQEKLWNYDVVFISEHKFEKDDVASDFAVVTRAPYVIQTIAFIHTYEGDVIQATQVGGSLTQYLDVIRRAK